MPTCRYLPPALKAIFPASPWVMQGPDFVNRAKDMGFAYVPEVFPVLFCDFFADGRNAVVAKNPPRGKYATPARRRVVLTTAQKVVRDVA